ncbi:hypothetical protein PPSIR1_15785 [Plesiocystis pacifica SIR-1]|uniref:Uncharacterized protein n=1 Tax=Plesiocystis pacifica SIR-1 TaxID=391625 RepID=A6GEN3_9BACT|nr:hypothetical protein PPSIR1_15785 [Plesiocystis pacifica SIR-1]
MWVADACSVPLLAYWRSSSRTLTALPEGE